MCYSWEMASQVLTRKHTGLKRNAEEATRDLVQQLTRFAVELSAGATLIVSNVLTFKIIVEFYVYFYSSLALWF